MVGSGLACPPPLVLLGSRVDHCLRLIGNVEHIDNEFTSSFFEWRHHSTRMLLMTHGRHTDPDRLKTILRRHVGKLILARNPKYDVVEERLDDLVRRAIPIDLQIVAMYHDARIEMVDPETQAKSRFPFDDSPGLMRQQGGPLVGASSCNGRTVRFISQPLVRIYGKRAGHSVSDYLMDFSVSTWWKTTIPSTSTPP